MSHETNEKNPVQPSKSGNMLDVDLGRPESRRVTEYGDGRRSPEGLIIFSYTRADAIGDGVLVDLGAIPKPPPSSVRPGSGCPSP